MAAKRAAAAEQTADDSPSSAESFWNQWSPTSLDDVNRDTYGTERRSTLERDLRSDDPD